MTEDLQIRFAKDREGKPLAIVENFPGLGAELRPEELKKLARQLLAAARRFERPSIER